MIRMSKAELLKYYREKQNSSGKNTGELADFREALIENEDLTGVKLPKSDFTCASFVNVCLDQSDLSKCRLHNTLFKNCSLKGARLDDSDLEGAMLRGANMQGCSICGANLYASVLERANLTGICSDERTKFFRLRCPEEGAFIGYKKCCDNRIVELLIPADAKRSSATGRTCRCNKAKVMVIKSFDCSEYYEEAWSTVDENFVYRTGEWVQVPDFNEDRWFDSTTGIHFWMKREEAIAY